MNQAFTAVRVISLASSAGRRAAFERGSKHAGLDWSFFPAHADLADPLEYEPRQALRRFGRGLSNNEVGCYTSHFKCWQWLLQSCYEQAVILEDDVCVDWPVLRKLAGNRLSQHGILLLKLYSTHPVTARVVRYRLLSPHLHLVHPVGLALGTQAYVLTKEAAQALVSRYQRIAAPVDWVLSRYWEHGIGSFLLFPYPVFERQFESTVAGAAAPAPPGSLFDSLSHLSWRLRDRLAREYVERFVLARRPFGSLTDSGPPFLPTT